MGLTEEETASAIKRAVKRPLGVCVHEKLGHVVGIPRGLRNFRDPIFNLLPGTVNVAVEIGTCQGWFAYRMAKYLKETARIFCVDPFYDDKEEKYDGAYNLSCWKKNTREWFGKTVFLKRGESFDESQKWGHSVPIDFLFIDGDHHSEAVLLDLEGWVPRVRTGGLVAGHDIDGKWGDQVKKALELYGMKHGVMTIHFGEVYSFTGRQVTNCWWFYKQEPKERKES